MSGLSISDIQMIDSSTVTQGRDNDYDEVADMLNKGVQAARNPTAIKNWLYAVETMSVPSPETDIYDFNWLVQRAIVNHDYQSIEPLAQPLVDNIRTSGKKMGYPLFIRTGLFSGKHNWKNTCYIQASDTDQDIIRHLCSLIEYWYMVGGTYNFDLVVRKFIKTKTLFTAFDGEMPITQEFRLFTEGGVVDSYQFYWPEQAIDGHNPSKPNWRELLRDVSKPSDSLLNEMIVLAENVASLLDGDWSIDFLIDENGKPILIDMAERKKSFVCTQGITPVNR
jgi:hypothetical protein